MNDKIPQRTLASWVEFLKDGILLADVDDGAVAALCCYLADLGALTRAGAEDWHITPPFIDSDISFKEQMEQRLTDMCATEKGFALHYFLKNPPDLPHTDELPDPSGVDGNRDSNARLLERTTSNLSNLQLVKKYGRQVQSFMELEKNFTGRLVGVHTRMKEARKLFNFILSRMKQKTEPRPWEQLSRRRHK